MRYRVLQREGIERAAEALRSGAQVPNLANNETIVGVGEMLDEDRLVEAAAKIRKLQREIIRKKEPPEELDRLAFEVVHKAVPRSELLLGDIDFWTRFAIVHLSNVIYKRFPGKKKSINLDNFGVGKRRECWPYKLWVRGEISYAENRKDKYELGRLGSVDIWTSHVHRQKLMSIRNIFQSVFAFQYPKRLRGKPYLYEGEEDARKGGVPGLRTLIKRLKQNWASVEFSCLTENEANELVRMHAIGLHTANERSVIT